MFYTLNLSFEGCLVRWGHHIAGREIRQLLLKIIFPKSPDVNILLCFRYKPALASSEAGEGKASNAVDGIPTIVHEGRKCSETKSEKSPWWTVDLLTVQVTS